MSATLLSWMGAAAGLIVGPVAGLVAEPVVGLVVGLVAGLVIGLLIGLLYWRGLQRNVALYLRPRGRHLAVLVHGARLVGVALVFCAMAQVGALPLLGMFAGFLVSRTYYVRNASRRAP